MALNFKVKLHQKVHVDDRFFEVVEWLSDDTVSIKRDDGTGFTLSADRTCEVFPGVMISLGFQSDSTEVSLVFQAPRSIPIYREGIGTGE